MKFMSALSLETQAEQIVDDLIGQIGDAKAFDLAIAFINPDNLDAAEQVFKGLQDRTQAIHFIGCTAAAIIGKTHEVEDRPSTSLLVANLPGVHIEHIVAIDEIASGVRPDTRACILLVDPFSTDSEELMRHLNELAPEAPVIGGIASWASRPGQNRITSNGHISESGFVGLLLSGNLSITTVVSQGCRPIGAKYEITASHGNVIDALDNESPLEILQDVFAQSSEPDQNLMRGGTLVGCGVSSDPHDLGHGSFLIRGLLGANTSSGALSVAGRVNIGDIAQFHVRDARSARDDLEMLLTPQAFESTASGALLFTCTGRGHRFFGEPDVDISITTTALGETVPTAGFFCAGEFGPIGNENFVHGYTASAVIFRPQPTKNL